MAASAEPQNIDRRPTDKERELQALAPRSAPLRREVEQRTQCISRPPPRVPRLVEFSRHERAAQHQLTPVGSRSMKEARPSKRESMDRRFALVDNSGELRYPYKKTQQGTGKYGFVVGIDRHGQGEYLDTIEEVIRAVVFEGKRVRVSVDPPTEAKGGSGLSLRAGREVKGYVISGELRGLVQHAPVAPIGEPREFQNTVKHSPGEVTAVYMVVTQDEFEHLSKGDVSVFLTRKCNWSTVDEWQAARRGDGTRIPVLIQLTAENAGAMWAAEIESLKCNPGPTAVVEVSGLGRLQATVAHSQVMEFHTGKPLDDTVQRSDIPCVLGPALADAIRRRALQLPGDAEVAGSAQEAESEINSDPQCAGEPDTVRRALINARVGQGGYRKRMVGIWGARCAVTQCSVAEVLVASHAKAWRLSSNWERLDAFNGLLLAAHLDRLFDAGLISFNDTGKMLVAPGLSRDEMSRLGIEEGARLNRVHPRHLPYLAAHRIEHGFES